MSKDKSRKPDYDEKEIPKVLKGPVEPPKEDKPEAVLEGAPLRSRPDYGEDPVGPQEAAMMKDIPIKDLGKPPVLKDYDESEGCPCQEPQTGGPEVGEEVCMPGQGDQGTITILVCPDCGNEGPFNMAPPAGIPMEARTLKCASCKSDIPFKGIVKTASGKYVVAGTDSIKSMADRIRGIVKQGVIVTWDLAQDVSVTLDRICKLCEGKKKDKD
jgi:hypothetical protein